MPSFFIDRPIFAWVVALFICLIGAISIPLLAVAQYPIIAPPSISISTSYPGASPENLYNSVTRLIEEELNGAKREISGLQDTQKAASEELGRVLSSSNADMTNALRDIRNLLTEQRKKSVVVVPGAEP